jgi:hypothetical protein
MTAATMGLSRRTIGVGIAAVACSSGAASVRLVLTVGDSRTAVASIVGGRWVAMTTSTVGVPMAACACIVGADAAT